MTYICGRVCSQNAAADIATLRPEGILLAGAKFKRRLPGPAHQSNSSRIDRNAKSRRSPFNVKKPTVISAPDYASSQLQIIDAVGTVEISKMEQLIMADIELGNESDAANPNLAIKWGRGRPLRETCHRRDPRKVSFRSGDRSFPRTGRNLPRAKRQVECGRGRRWPLQWSNPRCPARFPEESLRQTRAQGG